MWQKPEENNYYDKYQVCSHGGDGDKAWHGGHDDEESHDAYEKKLRNL